VASETGIFATQKIVSHPLTRRMKTGSPCTETLDHVDSLSGEPPTACLLGERKRERPRSKPGYCQIVARGLSIVRTFC
jgi:hypothetical protein